MIRLPTLPTQTGWATRRAGSTLLPVLLVTLVVYLLLAGFVLNHYHGDLRSFSLIGQPFLTQSNRSIVILPDPDLDISGNGVGYDGQFVYYIALDPVNAHSYLDNPPYRYTRILLPVLARLIALGQPEAIPLTIVLVNLLAAVGGTTALAAWCQWRGLAPWWALVYGLSLGQMMAFARNLTEVLAYALVAGAVYCFDCVPERRGYAAILFGLAALARETTLLFAVLYSLRLLYDAYHTSSCRPSAGVMFSILAVGPALLWQAGLYIWLGSPGVTVGPGLTGVPLAGLLPLYSFAGPVVLVIVLALTPALLSLGGALQALWSDPASRGQVEVWGLLLNTLLFTLCLPAPSLVDLYATARIGLGGILAAVYAFTSIRTQGWFYLAVTGWTLGALGYFALVSGLLPLSIWP